MAWWLKGAIFKHFGWVRNPFKAIFYIFLESGKKSKKKIQEKSVFIGKIGDFFHIFFSDFSTAKSFPGPSKSDFCPKNRPISTIFLSLPTTPLFTFSFKFSISIRPFQI